MFPIGLEGCLEDLRNLEACLSVLEHLCKRYKLNQKLE
jgi:hypothetical protein